MEEGSKALSLQSSDSSEARQSLLNQIEGLTHKVKLPSGIKALLHNQPPSISITPLFSNVTLRRNPVTNSILPMEALGEEVTFIQAKNYDFIPRDRKGPNIGAYRYGTTKHSSVRDGDNNTS